MPRRPIPWWLLVIGVAFAGYFTVIIYCDIWRPQRPGWTPVVRDGSMVVDAVAPGSPAARANLRVGDRLLSVAGITVSSQVDWLVVDANIGFDRSVALTALRDGEPFETVLELSRAPVSYWLTPAGYILLSVRLGQAVTLVLALLIAARRPQELTAHVAAWLLATAGVFCVVLPSRMGAVWRSLPDSVAALLWLPHVSTLCAAAILFTFFALFPRRLFRSGWLWLLIWTPMLVALVGPLAHSWRLVVRPDHPPPVTYWPIVHIVVAGIYAIASLIALGASYGRLDSVIERRRWRVVVAGAFVGLISGALVLSSYYFPTGSVEASLFASPLFAAGTVLFVVFPLSLAYAILKHRLLDLGLIVRQGIRYALARRLLLSVVPALVVFLIVDLRQNVQEGFASTLQARGVVYLIVGIGAVVAHAKREHWLDSLDRRFFRERYDAQRLLRTVAQQVRQADDFDTVAANVVDNVHTALHPEFIALFVRRPGQEHFRQLSARPAAAGPQTLRGDSKLMTLVKLFGRPLQTSPTESSWPREQLPGQEAELVRRSRMELIVPVLFEPDGLEAVFVLGVKRSELPYSREDQDLLGAIADNLALLVERQPASAPSTDTFLECPSCGSCYDPGQAWCVLDRSALTSSTMPRVLADRYRLMRRIGRGGMGTVYAAHDIELDRTVAAKVVRDDLEHDREAASRFRLEAQLAAGFTHPNVVTVHDFGINHGRRGYLIMELLQGQTLREVLKGDTQLPQSRVLEILEHVCAAVGAAHGQGLVHRDLKPENIFLVGNQPGAVTKVLDFGLAKALGGTTSTADTLHTRDGVLLGTIPYMSPERLRGGAVDEAWDLWALGVVAFEILRGELPFTGVNAAALDATSAESHTASLRARLSDAPDRSQEFFACALSLDTHKRPASAEQFFAQLREAISG